MKKIVNSLFMFLLIVPILLSICSIDVYSEDALEKTNTRYEAEDAEVINAVKKGKVVGSIADYGEYSGEGFVGSIDFATSSVIFTVTSEIEGKFELYVSYAIGTNFATATMNVHNDEGLDSVISFTEKNGWGSFDKTPVAEGTINLRAGENKISFVKGYNFVELDYIEIGQRLGDYSQEAPNTGGLDKEEGYTRYEAEEANIFSAVLYESGSFSGDGYVGNLDTPGVSRIEFEVTVEEDGEYEIRVAYAIGSGFDSATFSIHNDGGVYSTVRCEEKYGWGTFNMNALGMANISLRAGKNKVIIYKGMNFAQVDFIEIGPKIGDYKDSGINVEKKYLVDGFTRFEAEEQLIILAETKGIAYFVDFGTYSGLGYVGRLDSDDCYIEIPVTVEEDGIYEIRVAYAAYETGASFRIFSGTYGREGKTYLYNSVICKKAYGWGEFREDTIITSTVGLKAGDNFIRIKSGLIRCEIDFIDLGEKVADYFEGTLENRVGDNLEFDEGSFEENEDNDTVEKKGCQAQVKSILTVMFPLAVFSSLFIIRRKK